MVSLVPRTNGDAPTRRAPRPSSVQLKYVMAVSGAVMFLYLVAHMIGNLKIFFGAESLDLYAEWLRVCLLYTSPSPRDLSTSRMPSSA